MKTERNKEAKDGGYRGPISDLFQLISDGGEDSPPSRMDNLGARLLGNNGSTEPKESKNEEKRN